MRTGILDLTAAEYVALMNGVSWHGKRERA
jgi:hypothetical protein